MKTVGIICEYDPFHNGHKYLIEQARKLTEADVVVCVMSGNFTQRGEPAMFDKYTRAKAAVLGGADLVLELPFPFSCASAEGFATAGISILSSVGVDFICFGSECGSIELIKQASTIALSEDFKKSLSSCDKQIGSAAGYFSALEGQLSGAKLSSNDILGIEYVKAITTLNANITPITVKREGDSFNAQSAQDSRFTSATALRKMLRANDSEAIKRTTSYLPQESADIFHGEIEKGSFTEPENLSQTVLSFFRLCNKESLKKIAELGNGLENRLVSAAQGAHNISEFFSAAATKKYTDSRIRRSVIYSLTGVTKSDISSAPAFTTLLAANSKGRKLLSKKRKDNKSNSIEILTKPADYELLSGDRNAILRQAELSSRCNSIYALAFRKPLLPSDLIKKNAYIQ